VTKLPLDVLGSAIELYKVFFPALLELGSVPIPLGSSPPSAMLAELSFFLMSETEAFLYHGPGLSHSSQYRVRFPLSFMLSNICLLRYIFHGEYDLVFNDWRYCRRRVFIVFTSFFFSRTSSPSFSSVYLPPFLILVSDSTSSY